MRLINLVQAPQVVLRKHTRLSLAQETVIRPE